MKILNDFKSILSKLGTVNFPPNEEIIKFAEQEAIEDRDTANLLECGCKQSINNSALIFVSKDCERH